MANNLTVRDAAGASVTMKTIETAGVHTPYQVVGSMEKKFRDSFTGASLDSTKWDYVSSPGASVTVSGGNLTFASGTGISENPYILSKEYFAVPFRIAFNLTLSQRIANQSLYVEVVSVNGSGTPDGLHEAGWVFDGTTVTQAKYSVANGGLAALVSSASTIPTTAGSGFYEIEAFADEVWFHGSTIDSTGARANSYRRQQQIPDPNANYKIKISWLNGGTAPASSTNAIFQFIAAQDYQELTAEITAGRGQSVAGQAIGVQITGGTTLVTAQTTSTSYGYSSYYNLLSAATTNATSVKTSVGVISEITLSNNSANLRYFKLYNKASAPTVGTDTPIRTIMIPANTTIQLNFPGAGLRLATGIAFAVTGGVALADTTAIAANEIIVGMSYA